MRNLTNVFLDSAPSRFKLPFGISTNVILKSVSNEIRRDKKDEKVNRNCYMTFASVDVEENNKIKAERTFSYFNLDNAKFAVKNFMQQVNQLLEIAHAIVPADSIEEVIDALDDVLYENEELFEEASTTSGTPKAKFVKELGVVQNELANAFTKAMLPFTGENSELVNLLVVTGTNGQFFELPREDKGFISKVEGGRKLTIDAKYLRWYAERDTKKKAKKDDIGDVEEIMDEEEIAMEDDQNLDGI